jgi:hypothetical protein
MHRVTQNWVTTILRLLPKMNCYSIHNISGPHDSKYEDECLLRCAMQSHRN